jgi:hypothetical protein
MSLMRHTDLRLTMKVYTDPRIFDLAGAVEKLPINLARPTEAESAQATGTDGKPIDPDGNPPRNGGSGKGDESAGRSESVSSPSAEIGDRSAGIGGNAEAGEEALSPATGGDRQQKTPSGGDGAKERAMGFEPTTSALGRLHSTTELRPHFHSGVSLACAGAASS